MTEIQRLKEVIGLLGFKTQKDFADRLKLTAGALSDATRGRRGDSVSQSLKDRLELVFNLNIEWLESGKGEPFIKKGPIISESKEGVPYFDISLAEIDHVLNEEQAEYFVNYKPFNDCTAYLPVYGDSMYPKYASGEIIAVREITNYEVLQWGEAYVIMMNEAANSLRSIKLIYQHSNDNKLILRSSNPNFKGDTVIEKKNIAALYIIKGKITRNLI
ncbi:LexA family transcriptional regulator [Pedobacter sp.]|uniref:LexA family transcriptional regulator n=1 Tax=Pedobacter sp. TaxID=1411316 RepID=UPI003BAB6F17